MKRSIYQEADKVFSKRSSRQEFELQGLCENLSQVFDQNTEAVQSTYYIRKAIESEIE